jgi:hypothetical protein
VFFRAAYISVFCFGGAVISAYLLFLIFIPVQGAPAWMKRTA